MRNFSLFTIFEGKRESLERRANGITCTQLSQERALGVREQILITIKNTNHLFLYYLSSHHFFK